MKKPKHFLTWIAGALLMLMSISSWAQIPTYTAILASRTQPSCNTFEFDVMLKRTGTVVFQLAQFQMGITMNPALVAGGTITVTPVANSSTLTNPAQIPGPEKFSYDPVKNCIIVTAVSPPGTGNGSIILSTGSGTKYIRIRVMNSVPWPAEATNVAWNFNSSTGYVTKMFAYTPSNTDITTSATHTVATTMLNATPLVTGMAPPAAQVLTGDGGTYCDLPGATGAPVGLAASVNGVAYELIKNGVPTGAIIYGNGSAISWGNRTQGTYTAQAYVCGTTPFPTSATILPPIPPATASVFITTDIPGNVIPVPGVTLVTFYANPDPVSLAAAGTTYEWFVNTVSQGVYDITFQYIPFAGDVVDVVMTKDPEACVTPAVVTGTITMVAGGLPATADAGPNQYICAGQTVTLAGVVGGCATTGIWSGGTGTYNPNNTTLNAIYTPSAAEVLAGTVTLTLTTTDPPPCGPAFDVMTITIHALPVATASSNTPVCVGGTLNLYGVTGMALYAWTGPNGFISNLQNPSIFPVTLAAAGLYTLTVTDGNNCSAQASTVVVINALPVATASSNTPVCVGGTLNLFGGPNLMTTYAWTGPNGFISGAQNPSIFPVTLAAAGLYTLTVTDGNNCSAQASTVVVINALPVATASSNTPVCVGGTLNLFGGPNLMTTYAWTGPNGFTSGLQNPSIVGVTAAAAGTYFLTVTDGNNCSASAQTVVVINALPVATASSNSPVCIGGTLNLVGGPNLMTTYAWTGPNGFISGLQNPSIVGVTVAASGTYTLTVTDGNGCSASASTNVAITPNILVSVSIAAIPPGPVYTGTSVTFTATPTNGGTTPFYQWYVNGGAVGSGGTTYSYVPANGDLVKVVMTSSLTGSCVIGNPATSNIITMVVNSPANAVWTGNINNDWHIGGNWDTGIPGPLTNVTIPTGRPNYPTLTSGGTCHDIFFGSTALSTATLLDNGLLIVNGTATVQRYFTGYPPPLCVDWHLISSPISNALSGVFLGMYLQNFDKSLCVYHDIIPVNVPLNVMEGYGVYSTLSVNNTVAFVGNLNFGLQYKDLTASCAGWNLLGNPYVSSIDWGIVTIPPYMDQEVHYIEASTGNDLWWTQSTGGPGSQYIPPMQGFFVHATGPGPFSLNDAQRTHLGANIFYKSDNPKLLILEAAGTNYSDQAWIQFNDQAGVEHDGVYDAYKRISTSNPLLPQLFSLTPSGEKLALNGMPEASTVPVGFTAVQSGVFTISTIQTGEFTYVSLEDLFNKTFTDLLANSYQFTYTAGDQENRFVVHFKPLSVDGNQADLITIYSSHKDVYISVPANKQGSVKIFNMLGQPVAKAKIVDVLTKLTIDQTSVYTVQVTINDKIYIKKVIIRE